ncbi:hypothetical protein GCM10027614_44460 [Micromonospora vulcania]
MGAATGGPGAPARRRLTGQRRRRDRQQEIGAGQEPEVELLVVGAQRVPHGHLGLRGRLPFGHGHLSFREQATGIAYNLQGGFKITMAGWRRPARVPRRR